MTETQIAAPAATSVIPDTVSFWLRAEGAAALVAGGVLYQVLGGNWLFALPLLLLPDLSAVGYLGGLRLGSFTYNLVHNWVVGLAALGLGVWLSSELLLFAGTILVAHVGMDRLVGYGLKYTWASRTRTSSASDTRGYVVSTRGSGLRRSRRAASM